MEETQAGSRTGETSRSEAEKTPLERSWSAAAVLVVWLGAFAAFSFSGGDDGGGNGLITGWDLAGPAVVLAATAVLVGLAVFLPARPSAAGIRGAVYGVPVVVVTLLLLLTEPGIYVGLAIALLPFWALLTALYGVRGGLPAGRRYLFTYAAAALAAVGAGYVAVRVLVALPFAGLPAGIFGWLLPLLPLLFLLQARYRRNGPRTVVEIALSVLVASCGTAWFGFLGYGPGWSPDVGAVLALPAWVVAVIPAAAALGLGYVERFDTAEYQSRAERLSSARSGQP
ncbi:hypothetical protein [Arthrobacter sp. Z1-15]